MTTPHPRTTEIAALLARLVELLGERPTDPAESTPRPAPRALPERILLTPEEAAETLRIGRTSLFGLIKSGEIESIRIGGMRRIPVEALNSYIERVGPNKANRAA